MAVARRIDEGIADAGAPESELTEDVIDRMWNAASPRLRARGKY
jgi:hypothetical protein